MVTNQYLWIFIDIYWNDHIFFPSPGIQSESGPLAVLFPVLGNQERIANSHGLTLLNPSRLGATGAAAVPEQSRAARTGLRAISVALCDTDAHRGGDGSGTVSGCENWTQSRFGRPLRQRRSSRRGRQSPAACSRGAAAAAAPCP
jgi:hypothetical protein